MMDYINNLEEYGPAISPDDIGQIIASVAQAARANSNRDVLKACYGAIDLTSLNAGDTADSVMALVEKAVAFRNHFSDIPDVASVCVWPSFVDVAGLAVGSSGLSITSVAGGFPSAQTYLEVKMLEVSMAVENGADEIDIVMNPGQVLSGDFDALGGEISLLREEVGEDVVMKVILETGELKTAGLIRSAALTAMMAGADFVKTSTGKTDVSATPEAVVVMCEAIKDFYDKTGRRVGLKVAGGIRTASDAVLYYTIVDRMLGAEWLNPSLFRIGASSAANSILSAIEGRTINYF